MDAIYNILISQHDTKDAYCLTSEYIDVITHIFHTHILKNLLKEKITQRTLEPDDRYLNTMKVKIAESITAHVLPSLMNKLFFPFSQVTQGYIIIRSSSLKQHTEILKSKCHNEEWIV